MMRGVVATVATVAAIVALAVAFVLVQSGAPRPTASASIPTLTASIRPSPSPTGTRAASPSATPVDTSVVASGTVVPLRSADLAARVTGVVDAVFVQDGSEAEANQLLVRLDQSTYLAAVAVAEADLVRATAAVEQAQTQLDQLPPDASPGQIEAVQANLRLAEAERDLAESTRAEAQTRLLQTEVRAPFGGTVAEVAVEEGEQALAGQTVVTIGDTSGWLIETTDLTELEVARVAVGDRATVTFDALPGTDVDGTVERIEVRGTTDVGGVIFAVAIRPDVHRPELRWGMSASVRISPTG